MTTVTCDWHKYKTAKELTQKQEVQSMKTQSYSQQQCDQTIDSILSNLNLLKTDLKSHQTTNELMKASVLKTKPKLSDLTSGYKKPDLKVQVSDHENASPLFNNVGCFDSQLHALFNQIKSNLAT